MVQRVRGLAETVDHLFLLLPPPPFTSLPPTTSLTAAVLPYPHLFGKAVCSDSHNPPPTSLTPTACFNAASTLAATYPSTFYLVFYRAGTDVVRFGPLCQSGGSSIAASRHRDYIDQGGQLMVIAGSLGLNQRPHLLPGCGRRSSGRGGKYVLHPMPLVLESCADKTHIKNQFMH